MPLSPSEVLSLYTLGTPLRPISLFFCGFWGCRDCWTQSNLQQQQQQQQHFAVNARLSPDDDMKRLDLFFCVRVMGAICAHVLVSSLSLSVPCSYIINPLNAELNPIRHLLALLGAQPIFHVSGLWVNLFIHIFTCLRMLNHTSVMVCVTELFFVQVNVLLGKHCCKVFCHTLN